MDTTLTVSPDTVAVNPGYDSDWLKAVYQYIITATQDGQTVGIVAAEKTFTPAEAGQQLGMSRSAVQRHIVNGDIRARKHGSRYRIGAAEIQRVRAQMYADVLDAFANDPL